jgi:hypothetical protein
MREQDRSDDLIDRYVHEVGRRLPRAQRTDVENELRSLLEETLESRVREQGDTYDHSTDRVTVAADVLRKFGAPDDVANRYSPQPRHLIGPRLYTSFLTVLKVVLPSMVGIALFVTLMESGWTDEPTNGAIGTALLRWLGLSFQMAMSALAQIVVIFAVVERLHPQTVAQRKEWDPFSLPPVDDPARVSMTNVVLKIYVIIFFAVVFNFYPSWVGIFVTAGDRGSFISARDLGISIPIVSLNVWWFVAFWKNLLLARNRRWTRLTRWLDVGLGIFAVVILAGIVVDVWYSPWSTVIVSRIGEPLSRILRQILASTLAVAAVTTLAHTLKRAWRLVTSPSGGRSV